jgi:hydroxymethylpyrimidine/phosphomethylpyrimidine kinase
MSRCDPRGRRVLPVALTIAGSDSGGGAGVQADLKTFAALGVHGTSAITCVTAQHPRAMRQLQVCRPALVRSQIEAVFEELPPAAVKTGMLFSPAIVRVVASFFVCGRCPPLIVDPVMVATSGARLLAASALRVLERELLPRAALVTPNLDETEVLTGNRVRSVEGMRVAAREIRRRYGCAALVKGGHLRGVREAVDIFYDGETELLLSAAFVRGVKLHGTGCAYSAAIAAGMALGHDLVRAVVLAKEHVSRAIARRDRVCGKRGFWASLRV